MNLGDKSLVEEALEPRELRVLFVVSELEFNRLRCRCAGGGRGGAR
jgi:hypothetical protein